MVGSSGAAQAISQKMNQVGSWEHLGRAWASGRGSGFLEKAHCLHKAFCRSRGVELLFLSERSNFRRMRIPVAAHGRRAISGKRLVPKRHDSQRAAASRAVQVIAADVEDLRAARFSKAQRPWSRFPRHSVARLL